MAHAMPQVDGVEHRFVRAGETSFHVALAGEGDPLLLVHDWPQHWYAWRHVIPRLAERHRVVALDLRGFGWSDIAWQGFETPSLVADVVAVVDELELERVGFLGHGWGGWVGFNAALEHPDRIGRLCALGALPPWLRPSPRALAALLRLRSQVAVATPFLGPRLCRIGGFVTGTLRRSAADRSRLDDGALRLYARDLRASTRARAAALLNRTFLTRELVPVLAGRNRGRRLTVPTLVLTGEHDLLSPELIARRPLPADDLSFETVPGAGHLLPEERPDVVVDRALGFFAAGAGDAGAGAPISAPAGPS